MALKIENKIEQYGRERRFDSYFDNPGYAGNWYFKYTTLDTDGNDQTETGGTVERDKSKYPVGTIFFDSSPVTVYLTSTIENIVIDTTPPEFTADKSQYMVFRSDFKCDFTIKSDTPIDIAQLVIANGDTVLYKSLRKNTDITSSGYVKDIAIAKNNDTYRLTFTLDKEYIYDSAKDLYDTSILNEGQITVVVWDIAGNMAKYTTDRVWYYLDLDDNPFIKPLIIEFIDINPKDFILSPNVEGKVLVKVTNPNVGLRDIVPTVQLSDESVGFIDRATFTYDPGTGILLFYVTNIFSTGMLTVQAWISVDNPELYEKIKTETYAEASIGPFVIEEEGRKYKFWPYVPKYLDDEKYKDFVMFTQKFMNTCHNSLNTGNRISGLEKIARVGYFNDVDRIEYPLLDYLKDEFNFEITPNFVEYLHYMYNMPDAKSIKEENDADV